ncbi:TrfB-related DNA-binding protein (plasmid) [Ampullimonas aquatilis]|uniref:TrfB-related DNA-binding protein n=1 Tax=Ampullimonas aquatilis TaxID=1341549 RepID=UPI003C75B860
MGVKSPYRMKAIHFDTLRPFIKMNEKKLDAARLALVDGIAHLEIANQFGWKRQFVGQIVKEVQLADETHTIAKQNASLAVGKLLPGWELVTLIAPTNLINKFRAEIDKVTIKSEI